MTETMTSPDELAQKNEALRQENERLKDALEKVQERLREPEEIIRAIRHGEIDAFVVQESDQEEIHAVQHYASVYRDLVEESLPYGVWLSDVDGQLIYVSRQFLECARTNLQEIREKGQFHFLPEETRKVFAERWASSRASGAPCDFRYSLQCADGSERKIWTYGILTQSHDGRPCWVGINLDVTEQTEVKDELRRKADELEEVGLRKDEFLALLGHELRNPMAVIHNGLYMLRETNGDPATFRQIIEPMVNQVNHLRRLVDDLLDVSRISRGTIELRKQQTALSEAVRNAIESVRPLIEAQGHQLNVSLPANPVNLKADPTRLEQILANLLNNAAKYTDPGGTIDLVATLDDDAVFIRIADNGMGIVPEILPRIFDLFVQSDRALDRAQGGLGIGLCVVRNLVEMHGGSISAHSDGPDAGSQFVVRLPVMAASSDDATTAQDQDAGPQAQAGGNLRILLGEDSRDLSKLLKMILRSWGHEVHVTEDGPSTLEAYRNHEVDVVLLDLGLPEVDGYEIARRIRSDNRGQQPVLVAVTGYGQDKDRARAQEAGFDHHLVKPAVMGDLERILSGVSEAKTRATAGSRTE